MAKSYISILEECLDATNSSSTAFLSKWENLYDKRTALMVQLEEILKLEFSNKYEKTYKEFLTKGKLSYSIQEIISSATFTETEDRYGFKTYTATVTNTSEEDFDYFCFDINLIDSSGVTVDTELASTDNWASGSTHKFEFMTCESFSKVEVVSADYTI